MNALILASLLAAQPDAAVAFDTLTLDAAARLTNKRVTVAFEVGRPAYTWVLNGAIYTVCGPEEPAGDDTERTAVLRGDRLAEAGEGKAVKAEGFVGVVYHPLAVVNGVQVPAWAEGDSRRGEPTRTYHSPVQ